MRGAPATSNLWYLIFFVVSFALAGSACALYEELEPLDRAIAVHEIEISPNPAHVEIFQSAQFTAKLSDQSGNEVRHIPVEWTSSNSTIVSVDDDGLAHAKQVGQAHLTARAGQVRATVSVTVFSAVKRIEIQPPSLTLSVDQYEQLIARVYGEDDELLSGRTLEWSSTDESIVTVDADGQIRGVGEGSATIRVRTAGVTGTASISVEKPVESIKLDPTQATIDVMQTLEIEAKVYDTAGETSFDRVVAWSSSRPEVASVSATGTVTGLKEGSTRITAQSGGKSAEARIEVTASTAQVVASPNSATIILGEELQMAARVLDAAENDLTGRRITWKSSDESIATVNTQGLVTGVAQGRVTITASNEGVDGTAQIDVINPVAKVVVSPDSVSLGIDQTQQLIAKLTNQQGDLLDDRSVTWRSDDPTIAEVDAQGLVTAKGPGVVEITATSEEIDGSTTVTVLNTVTTVELSPSTAQVEVTEDVQLQAVAKNTLGATVPDAAFTWKSSDISRATVDEDGLVTTKKGGSVTITAKADGIEGTALITIDDPVRSVSISPDVAMVGRGTTLHLTATLRDRGQNELDGRDIFWSSGNDSIATVDQSGVVEGVALGQTTITATSEGISDTIDLEVSNPVAKVNLSPSALTLTVGATQAMSVELLNAQDEPLTGRHVQWSSDNEDVARVSAAGVVTARGVGATTIRATSEGITGVAQIGVENPIAFVEVTPTNPSIEVTGTIQLQAVAKNELGGEVPGASFSWKSSDTSRATVDENGLVTTKKGGSVTITATADGIDGTASITIDDPVRSISLQDITLEITETAQLSAILKDKAGNVLTGRTIQWSSARPNIASVDEHGEVKAKAKGSATITASVDQVSESATITVEAPPRSLEISPTSLAIDVGDTQTLTAVAKDRAGNTVSGLTANWTSASAGIAKATSTGAMTAQISGESQGDTTITASVSDGSGGNLTADVPVSVTAHIASVEIAPEKVGLFTNDQAQLEAILRDANGNPLTGGNVSWSTDAPSVATVNTTTGLVTAKSPGQAQITATSNGIEGHAHIHVVTWDHISVHRSHSCGVLTNGEGFCWGRNSEDGILGNGSQDSGTGPDGFSDDANALVPTAISGDLEFEMVNIGLFHACGLTTEGKAYCWGFGGGGHLGQGTNNSSPVPVAVSGSYTFTDIQLGANHTCALDTAQRIYCWGANSDGQLGQGAGSAGFSAVPQRIQDHNFTAMAVGTGHTCAISTDGTTLCWGNNASGQLGDGSTTNRFSPVEVDTTQTFIKIASKYTHTCGLTSAGKAYCWGDNSDGGLGDGTDTDRSRPVAVSTNHSFETITTGLNTTCAITADKDAYCWGFNGQANLGFGSPSRSEKTPRLVAGGFQWESLSLGLQHTCGIAAAYDTVFCWGDNDHGQAGNGQTDDVLIVPTAAQNP